MPMRTRETRSGLCGDPIAVKCSGEGEGEGGDEQNGNNVDYNSKSGFIDGWFYLSVGLGFAVGIIVPCLVLAVKKPWSEKYFDFLDSVIAKFFVAKKTKTIQRRSGG